MAVLYGAWAFHAGYLRLQTHPQNMWYLLIIIIIIFINCKWVGTRWQWLFYMYTECEHVYRMYTECFSTTTVVAGTRLNITSIIRTLPHLSSIPQSRYWNSPSN
jgi:hypothetical protein